MHTVSFIAVLRFKNIFVCSNIKAHCHTGLTYNVCNSLVLLEPCMYIISCIHMLAHAHSIFHSVQEFAGLCKAQTLTLHPINLVRLLRKAWVNVAKILIPVGNASTLYDHSNTYPVQAEYLVCRTSVFFTVWPCETTEKGNRSLCLLQVSCCICVYIYVG